MPPLMRSVAVLLLLCAGSAACGGSNDTPAAGQPGASPEGGQAAAPAGTEAAPSGTEAAAPAVTEDRWLRGLWADDIRRALNVVSVTCTGPTLENRQSVWSCQSGTPLVSYRTLFYGDAPGKIEYITATVTQSDRPKDDLALRVFVALAGLHFEGADPKRARAWVRENIAKGGSTSFGSATFKLAGDARRRQLEIKARGSEW
ncbi:MAG TPA: hypothetical protein VK911_00915 [Vicinamibacterales bacterium]|nr:hypothetical protein [Vicinamibacterales bacterium]